MQLRTFSSLLLRCFICAVLAILAENRVAFADRIGGSNLPSPTPALKGRISESEKNATSVVVLSTAAGATSNAGPTFLETPSAFIDRGAGYAQVAQSQFGTLDFSFTLADRHYFAFTEADERSGRVRLALTKDWVEQQTILAFAAARGRDIEERLTQASLGITHTWTGEGIRPYVQAETVLLDFHDLPSEVLPFANQDDRDRISSRVQAGLRLTITEHVAVEAGAGVDTKHYHDRYDDFGVRRDSVSLFPLVGLALATEQASLRAVYMPFRRIFKERLFENAWKHGYAVEAEVKFSDALKAIASARHGFEETDFLVASAAYETVLVAGLMLSYGRTNFTLAASETRRDYEGLGLIGVARADRKREIAFTAEVPLFEAVSLTGRVSYMDFESSVGEGGLFGEIGTDVLTVSLGLTYAMVQ